MTSSGHFLVDQLAPEDGGLLGSAALTAGTVLPPNEVRLDGDCIVWRYTSATQFRPAAGMLDALLKVNSASDVYRFVSSYSPVSFCEPHRLPIGHNPVPQNPYVDTPMLWLIGGGRSWDPLPGAMEGDYCGVALWPGTWANRERLTSYLKLADQMRAACELGAKLRAANPRRLTWDDLGSDEEWLRLSLGERERHISVEHHPTPTDLGEPVIEDLYVGRYALEVEIRILTGWARLRPAFDWRKDQDPRFAIEADAFGHLMLQLIHAVAGTQGMAVCTGCELPYRRLGRRAAIGRNNYCPQCRTAGVASRDAKRRQRARPPSSA